MIPTTEFQAALAICIAHASTDRPDLQNIFFEFQSGDLLRIVGTDGKRLAL